MAADVVSRRALVAAAMAGAVAGCDIGPGWTFNYRFKVTCRVGEVLKQGASVIRVNIGDTRGSCCAANFPVSGFGEAPAINLGEQGRLFAMLVRLVFGETPDQIGADDRYFADMPVRTIGRRFPALKRAAQQDADQFPELISRVLTVRDEIALAPEDYPTLVRFRDLSNPATLELVELASFGAKYPGASLEGCSIQLVDGPPTRTLERVLPWLAHWPERGLDRELGPPVGHRGDQSYLPHIVTDEYFVRRG